MATQLPKSTHGHFCFLCLSMPSSGVKNSGGWWKCAASSCTKPQSELCMKHDRLKREIECTSR